MIKNPGKKFIRLLTIAAILALYALIAVIVVFFVSRSGIYPSGSDTMCHIYKSDILYQDIIKGNWYPLYDSMWYNGVEMMRYWAPLPVYIIAGCQALGGGDPFNGYLIFVGFIFFFGAIAWLWLGFRHKRPCLGSFLGVLWFFMPNNLYAIFGEGNLPRAVCMIFLPLFISYLHDYFLDNKWGSLPKLILCFSLMALCHLGYAGMIALATIVFLVVYGILFHRQWRKILDCICTLALGFLLIGLWAYASLQGGLVSMDSSQIMAGFFQDAVISLDPTYRIHHGHGAAFYYGLAAFITGVLGIIFSRRYTLPGFLTAIIIFFCTTTTMYPVLVLLPGSQYLWMLRFISIALCFTLYSLLLWRSLRKGFLFLLCLLLVLDSIPSLNQISGLKSNIGVDERFHAIQADTLLDEAKAITTQRLTLIDFSTLGATAAFLISDYENAVPATFGAGWQSANTARNIVQLNQATSDGGYLYLFDRCLELGSDTVVVQTQLLHNGSMDAEQLDSCAETVGYHLIRENSAYRLYHYDASGSFGLISKFRAIGIGTSAPTISIAYPAVEETESTVLDDYTYEQLSQYDVIYLAGFTYKDRDYAEDMLLRLSENGVRIIIMADGIPADEQTGTQTFLGVSAYGITFSSGYPELDTIDGLLNCDLFPDGYSKWRTVYVNGLDDVWGTLYEEGNRLDFFGTVHNENIIFIGLNLTYHYALTRDAAVGKLLTHALSLSPEELPQRTVVPLSVTYEGNTITVHSDYDDVNTTLAFHDIFDSEQEIYSQNHLTYVKKGDTVIRLHYPYLLEGTVVSVVGLLMSAVFLHNTRRREKKRVAALAEAEAAAAPEAVPGEPEETTEAQAPIEEAETTEDAPSAYSH